MPSSPYAKLLVQVNGAALTSGGIEIPSGATVQFSGESTVGWTRARFEIIDYPEGWAVPSGYMQEADGTIVSTALVPPAIVFPANTVLWGKWFPRLIVNEQIDNSLALLAGGSLMDDTTALSMLSPKGQRDILARETTQFTTPTTRIKAWARDIQRNLRMIEAIAIGSPAGGAKQLQYNTGTVMGGVPEWTYQGSGRLQVDPTTGFLAYGSGTMPAIGVNRLAYSAGVQVLFGMKDSTSTDRSLFQVQGNTATLGNATAIALSLVGSSLALTTAGAMTMSGAGGITLSSSGGALKGSALAGTLFDTSSTEGFLFTNNAYGSQISNGRIYAAANLYLGLGSTSYVWLSSSAGVALGVNGQNVCFFTASPTYGAGAGVLFILAATTAPTSSPTGGAIVWFDSVSGFLKVRNPLGRISTLDGSLPDTNGMRLTLTSGTPIPTADVATATTIYLTPHTTATIALYDASNGWASRQTAEVSLALGTLVSGKNYDVFAYYSGSVQLILSSPWASDTVRTDALVRQDGILVKSGAPGFRYVGTIRTISTTQTTDTIAQRFVYNTTKILRNAFKTDTGATYGYTTSTFRQTRALTSNRVEVVVGELCPIEITARSYCVSAAGIIGFAAGIGIDSITVNSAQTWGSATGGSNAPNADQAEYKGVLPIGYHALNWLELGGASGVFNGPTIGVGIHAALQM